MKLKELKKAEMIKINGGDGFANLSGDITITGNNFVENNTGTVFQNNGTTLSPKDTAIVLDLLSDFF
ncbi:MAG: hypothetical protein JWR76_1474 [Mucilaginibacter sp.]|jgi:hypothetical protein|nr:hypothetical protein [Mucilaginibacter sp.]